MDQRLTKYERARVLGVRATQIEQQRPSCLVELAGLSALEIARRELDEGKLSLTVRRRFPGGAYVDIVVGSHDANSGASHSLPPPSREPVVAPSPRPNSGTSRRPRNASTRRGASQRQVRDVA
jgi:DNA-directed RNA polymerase subunit K/omega